MRTLLLTVFALVACGGKTSDEPANDASTSADSSLDGSPGDFAACSGPGTCVLAANGCCGTCGAPKLSDYTAINASRSAAFRASTCTDPAPTCPGCVTMEDPNLQAFCRGGRCASVDLRTEPVSSCAADSDCVLRYEACCECGASGDATIIAIHKDRAGAYSAERCAGMTACPECAPVYPSTLRAVCLPMGDTTKHCVVRPL